MKSFLLLTFLIFLAQARYNYLTYQDILSKLKGLAETRPRFVKLVNIREENGAIPRATCGAGWCDFWYLKITDFSQPEERIRKLPQVLIMGGIHGDERLGPNIVTYLAEYLIDRNQNDVEITNLIKNRMIILYPMSNPSGYYYNQREEKTVEGKSLDPNRDFPYSAWANSCFKTGSSRAINHLFKTNLIQAAITFHGGLHSLTYPWGCYNHATDKVGRHATESPDDRAFADVAAILRDEGGSNSHMGLQKYTIGKMNDVVYAVYGSFEDWVYAASWEGKTNKSLMSTCPNVPAEELDYNSETFRTFVYLIETDLKKSPREDYLGSVEGMNPRAENLQISNGHIPINMRISLALIDLVEPYVRDVQIEYQETSNKLSVTWKAGGCKSVSETYIIWKDHGSPQEKFTKKQTGPGYYTDKGHTYKEVLSLQDKGFLIDFSIILSCDQDWAKQISPDPAVGPQTHLVRARIDENYHVSANGYEVNQKKTIIETYNSINQQYFDISRVTNLKELVLSAIFYPCQNYVSKGEVLIRLDEVAGTLYISFDSQVMLDDPFLEGHLHTYGDTSACLDSIGSGYNLAELQPTRVFKDSFFFGFELGAPKILKINSRYSVQNQSVFANIIGRSILLEKPHEKDYNYYFAQIVPKQPPSCSNDEDMKGCLGLPLTSPKASCQVKLLFEEAYKNFKLIIEPNYEKKILKISGYIPSSFLQHYGNQDEIYIVNERVEKKFTLSRNVIHGYLYIKPDDFELQPKIALGNMLRVYGRSAGLPLLFGDCFIVNEDPEFNDVGYLNNIYAQEQRNKKQTVFGELFFVLKFLVVTIAVVVLKIKRESFEVMITARKEGFQYTDTAKALSSRISTRQDMSNRQNLLTNLNKQVEKESRKRPKEIEIRRIIKEDQLNEDELDEGASP